MAENFLSGIGDIFETLVTNSSGIADAIKAVNSKGATGTLTTPGAVAAPTTSAPGTPASAMTTGMKAALIGGGVLIVGILLYLFTGRKRR